MKELLFKLFSGAIENVGESKLEEVLQKLHDNDETEGKTKYVAALRGGYALVQALQPLVDSSKTQIDDVVLSAIGDAIRDSALANGIEL